MKVLKGCWKMIKVDIELPGGDIYLFDDEMAAFNWAVGVARDHGINTGVFKNPEKDEWVVLAREVWDRAIGKKYDGWLGKGQVFG